MLINKIKDIINLTYDSYYYFVIHRHEMKNIAQKKKLWRKISLTEKQNKEILSVFGKKIGNRWHRLYQSYTGNFNQYYFPQILFSTKLEPILSPRKLCMVLQDKSMMEIMYSSVPRLKLPKTIVVNCSGVFYDGSRNIINRGIALYYAEYGLKNKSFVIKPIVSGLYGNGTTICESGEYGNRGRIEDLFDTYDKNFIIQEYITNSPVLKNFSEKSLCCIKVTTYILDDKIHHAPITLVMGSVNSGDIYVGVTEEGYLKQKGFSETGEAYQEHPCSHTKFEGYLIPNMKSVIEMAYACHKKTPHARCVSWDFTLDENENVVLIKVNLCDQTIWIAQAVNGESLFGSNSERMLKMIGITGKLGEVVSI